MTKRFTEEQNKKWRESLPKKIVAVKVIIKSDKGNILLIKPDWKDTWQLPGGGVEVNEDPKIAAVREAKEETGMDILVQDLRLVDCIFKAKDDHLFLVFEYKRLCSENGDYSVDDEEIEGYKFVSPTEAGTLLPGYYAEFWDNYIEK